MSTAITYDASQEELFRAAVPSHGQWMTEAILAAARAKQLNPFLLGAIAYWESDFGQARGYDPKGAPDGWGDSGHACTPWQIDKRYHAAFLSSAGAKEISRSSLYAAGLVAQAARLFPGNIEAIIASYNAGPGAVRRAIAKGLPPGSCTYKGTYVATVIDRLRRLEQTAGVRA